MPLTLEPLPYAYDALEPHLDAATMQIHHGKHHQAYVTNANNALAGTPFADKSAEDLIRNLAAIPEDKRAAVRNNAGGHFNHAMFWKTLAPAGKGGGAPQRGTWQPRSPPRSAHSMRSRRNSPTPG